MMATGFLRVCSSGMLLLLLATTATLVQRAGAQTSATVAPVAACTAEYAACIAEETCNDCITPSFTSTAFLECSDSGFFDNNADCDSNTQTACCLDDVSEFDCMENEAFSRHVSCYLDSVGCGTAFSCDGAEVSSGADATANLGYASTLIALSCAFVPMLPLLL